MLKANFLSSLIENGRKSKRTVRFLTHSIGVVHVNTKLLREVPTRDLADTHGFGRSHSVKPHLL